ncbi:MAG: hypothetical protein ACM3N5_11755 [Candidatus Eiseniibacteriota bacterium]
MLPLRYAFAAGALVLLASCAAPSAFTQADLDRQAAINRCSAQANALRPVWNNRQLLSRPGQPRPLSLEYRNEINRRYAACMAASGNAQGRALDVPEE